MKVYTSYFANSKNLSKEGIVVISIARYSPKWFSGQRYTKVAPTGWMLSNNCTHDQYLRSYDNILRHLNPNEVIREVGELSQGRDVALCCYEKPGDFCHRHLLADWLTKNGIEVKEWESKEDKEKKMQLSLFD